MGWNTSLVGGGPWDPTLLESVLPGYERSSEQTDFGSASTSDSNGRVGVGILPNGMVVAASHSEYEALNDMALILSTRGKSGVFHLGSTGDYYEYSLFEAGGTVEHQASVDDLDDLEDDCFDPDDMLSLLDEEDGIGKVDLGEGGLLDLFIRSIGQSNWDWESDLVMHYYLPVKN